LDKIKPKTVSGSKTVAGAVQPSEPKPSQRLVVPLWDGAAPGALGNSENDIPTLTIYPAAKQKAIAAAMVICPGGGYEHLADYEGKGYAMWLNDLGVTCFVLKYRLASNGYHHPVELGDAARAVRLVRKQAKEWNIDPNRVGIMGSSAGGHLASTLLTHFDGGKGDSNDPVDRQSSRPNLGILCYPVITLGEFTHEVSKKNLLGEKETPEMVKLLSSELQVTKATPPCFIWHGWEDSCVLVENAINFAAAMRKAGVRFELHIYEKSGHGLGLGIGLGQVPGEVQYHPWTGECSRWLKEQGFIK
jgi:acetyl esterase/lipase